MSMRFGSLFSGIGGLDLGLERAGMTCAFQVEIDPFCQRVLEKHWPSVRRYGDIRELTGDELERTDLICGGFPCQDLSVAGKRAGLAGERSGLFFEFVRLVAALAPRWVLIENVPGLLSSNGGRDMGTVLGTLAEFGYGYAYRVLDAQYFGVAQRRRRVFIVGCLGDWTAAAEVLFEPESCERDTPPRRETGEDIARALTSSVGGVSGKEQQATYVASTTGRGWWNEGFGALRADAGGMEQSSHLVAIQDVRGGTRDKTDHGQGMGIRQGGPMYTLGATEQHAVAHPLHANRWGGSDSHGDEGNVVLAFNPQTGGDVRLGLGEKPTALHAGQVPAMCGMSVRRLTPTECERLQGFPDGWTALDGRAADSPRYRALGNAVCVPVAEWIGRRIVVFEHKCGGGRDDAD